jgi:hypothetical protein
MTVRRTLVSTQATIHVEPLSAYARELNPVQYLFDPLASNLNGNHFRPLFA